MLIGFVETSIFSKDYNGESTLNKFNISFVDQDKSAYGDALKKMLNGKEIKKSLNVEIDADENKAESKIKSEEVSTAIIIPKDFTKKIIQNKPKDIKLLKSSKDKINDNVVEGILKNFTDKISLKGSKTSYVDTTIIKKQSRVTAAQFAPFTFNYNYYKAYNVLMLGGNINSILSFILKLSIFGIIASILGSIIFKVEVNN